MKLPAFLFLLFLASGSFALAGDGWTDCPVSKGRKIQAFLDIEANLTLREGKKRLGKLKLPDEETFNQAKSSATCTEGKIEVWSEAGFSCFSQTYEIKFADNKMTFVKKSANDPCRASFDEASEALEKGDAASAAKLAEDVMYPQHYIGDDFGDSILEVGHKQALTLYKKGSKDEAAKAAEAVLAYASEAFDRCKDKCISKYNDIGFFLDEGGKHDIASNLLKQVVAVDPNRAVAWLNLADATWALGKKEEAAKAYGEYAKRVPKEKQPSRVSERVTGS